MKSTAKTTIGVVFGGRSTEHEISVISACQAMAAIDRDKYDVVPVYLSKQGRWFTGDGLADVTAYRNINALLDRSTEVYMRPVYGDYNLYRANAGGLFGAKGPVAKLDLIIPVLHGSNGEDGIFEGVLETIGIPYAGCSTLASANGMDKIIMKMILAADGIPVVPYVWFTDKQWFAGREALAAKVENTLGYPVIVKPANLGSSVGIGRADNRVWPTRAATRRVSSWSGWWSSCRKSTARCWATATNTAPACSRSLSRAVRFFPIPTSIWAAARTAAVCTPLQSAFPQNFPPM